MAAFYSDTIALWCALSCLTVLSSNDLFSFALRVPLGHRSLTNKILFAIIDLYLLFVRHYQSQNYKNIRKKGSFFIFFFCNSIFIVYFYNCEANLTALYRWKDVLRVCYPLVHEF